jgi:hypothetical protein
MTTNANSQRAPLRIPWWLGCILLSAIALFFLWEEHEAHILGVLPWLLFLACPLVHLFMHGGHGHSSGTGAGDHGEAPKAAVDHSQHRGRQT